MLEHFGESKLGKSATRQEMMILHRQLGRKYETVKRWTRQTIKKHAPKTFIKSFKELCSVKSKANVKYIAVCGPKCTKELGPQDLICPTCRKTIWHQSCLEQRFKLFQLDVPSFEGKWGCVDCELLKNFVVKK